MNTVATTSKLNVRRGCSFEKDEAAAVKDLAQQISQPGMSAVVFFASSKFDLERLGSELKEAFPVPLIGCTTSGEITPQGYAEGSLTGVSLASEELQVLTHTIGPLKTFDVSQAERVGDAVKEQLAQSQEINPDAKAFGLLLVDGLSVMEEQVLAAFFHQIDTLPLVGGSAGDDLAFQSTAVYVDGKFVSDCATISVFVTSLPFKTLKMQHFVPTDQKLVITKAEPNKRIVNEINGRPAATEYARILGLDISDLAPMIFTKYPVMLRVGGEYYVRSIQKVNDDGSLTFFCAIDEGLVLTLSEGIDLVKNLADNLERASAAVPNPQLIIGCECILRRLEVLENNITADVDEILGRHQVVGFHTYGEQFDSIHVNQTFTGVIIGC